MLKFLKFELTAAIVLLISAPVTAAPLTSWRYDAGANQLEVIVPAGVTPRYSLLTQPTRIVLDLPNTQMGAVDPRGSYSGAVREIRVTQFQPNVARIVLELSPNITLSDPQVQLQQVEDSDQTVGRFAARSVRWTLRPILAARPPSANTQAVFNSLRPIQTAPIAQTATTSDFGLPPAPPSIDTAPAPTVTAPPLPVQSTPLPTAPAVLPPLQPTSTAPVPTPGSSLLFPGAPIRSTTQSNPLQLPEVNSNLAIPNSFPAVNAPVSQPSVKVPQLDRRAATSEQRPIEPRTPAIEETPVPTKLRTIEFGQPLPR